MPWYQLTYASSEGRGAEPGGWQVLAQAPADTPEAIHDQLRAHVVTRLLEVAPTDEFANRAELDARSRRLFYKPVEGGFAWWHAAAAGKDATGRPGNVFTHGVVLTDSAGALRPMDLWRSPDWLAPFGAAEVSDATLGDFGRPGPLDRAGAVRWIHDHAEAMEALVAAVTWMFEEPRRHVVLVTDTVDEFAAWVNAVSHLTAPALVRQIPFVTYERAGDGGNAVPPSGFVGVPAADASHLADLRDESTLVLTAGALPEESVDGVWECDGQTWPVDPLWQDALYGASGLDAAALVHVLAVMDEITEPLEDNEWMSPGWPLALALLKVEPQRVQERDAMLADWERLRPWDGLRDVGLLQVLQPPSGKETGPEELTTDDAAPEPDVDEMRLQLEAAVRLVEYRRHVPPAALASVNGCIQLLLTHGLPQDRDPAATARARAFLGLEDVPPSIKDLLRAWTRLPSGASAFPRSSTKESNSHG